MRQDGGRRDGRRRPRRGTATRLLVLACAASAGAHAGLVPEHLHEAPRLGAAFIVAVGLLIAAGAALLARPADRRVARAAAVLMAGLIVAWAVSRTTGIPLLQPDPEEVDAVGVVTKLVEAAGLWLAAWLSQSPDGRMPSAIEEVVP
jgi:hypothetical protein